MTFGFVTTSDSPPRPAPVARDGVTPSRNANDSRRNPRTQKPAATTGTVPASDKTVRACGALSALGATRAASPSPNFLTSMVLAIVSLGVLPALLWPARFRRTADANRQALLELARWGRTRLNEADGERLLLAARRTRFYPSLFTLAMSGVVAAVGVVAWGLTKVSPAYDLASWVIGLTYGAVWPRYHAISVETSLNVFAVWTLGLSVAYIAHLAQVHLYAWSLRKFLDEFNKLSIAEGYAPVLLEPIGFGFSPWLLTCGGLMMLSGIWAIPMAFAGATDCRLRNRAFAKLEADLTGRVRDIIFAKPLTFRPVPAGAVARCTTDGCATALMPHNRYCPRCGVATGLPMLPRRAVVA